MNISKMNITESIVSYIKIIRELSPSDADCKAIDDAVLSIFETDYLIQLIVELESLIELEYDSGNLLDCLEFSVELDFKQLDLIHEGLDIPALI